MTMIQSSDVWKTMLGPALAESEMTHPSFEEDSARSMLVWLYHLHDKAIEDAASLEISDIWNIIEMANKYFLHYEKLKRWFANWMITQYGYTLD